MTTFQPRTMTVVYPDDRHPKEPYAFAVRHTVTVEILRFRTEAEAEVEQDRYKKQGYKIA